MPSAPTSPSCRLPRARPSRKIHAATRTGATSTRRVCGRHPWRIRRRHRRPPFPPRRLLQRPRSSCRHRPPARVLLLRHHPNTTARRAPAKESRGIARHGDRENGRLRRRAAAAAAADGGLIAAADGIGRPVRGVMRLSRGIPPAEAMSADEIAIEIGRGRGEEVIRMKEINCTIVKKSKEGKKERRKERRKARKKEAGWIMATCTFYTHQRLSPVDQGTWVHTQRLRCIPSRAMASIFFVSNNSLGINNQSSENENVEVRYDFCFSTYR